MSLFGNNSSLSPGDPAPDFELPDQQHRIHKLADYRDDWLVLFFYPRDMTPGCTKEVCGFQANYNYFQMTKTRLLGISTDSLESHQRFRSKHLSGTDRPQDSTRVHTILIVAWPREKIERVDAVRAGLPQASRRAIPRLDRLLGVLTTWRSNHQTGLA